MKVYPDGYGCGHGGAWRSGTTPATFYTGSGLYYWSGSGEHYGDGWHLYGDGNNDYPYNQLSKGVK